MKTSVKELQTYCTSIRTKLGKLKQLAKKSGQAAEGFTPTEQWIWKNSQFLAPHISEIKPRNLVSFKSKLLANDNAATSSKFLFTVVRSETIDLTNSFSILQKSASATLDTSKVSTQSEGEASTLGNYLFFSIV